MFNAILKPPLPESDLETVLADWPNGSRSTWISAP